mgnify:CR=1 FL=1
MNQSKAIAVLIEIANMKRGCAPSVGYMEELIIKARDALERKSHKCGDCENRSCCGTKADDVSCDEFEAIQMRQLEFE